MKSRFLKSLVSVGGGTIAVNLCGLLSVIIATRNISPEKLGIFFLLMAVIQILSTVAACGTNTTIVKFLAEEYDDKAKEKIIFSAINLQLCALLVTTAVAITCNNFFRYVDLKPSYLLFFLCTSLFTYLNSVLQGMRRFKVIAVVNALSGALKVVFVAFFVAYCDLGLEGLVLSHVLSNVIPIGLQLYPFYKNSSPKHWVIIDRSVIKEMLTFSYPLYLNNLFSVAFSKGYTLMIAGLLSPTAVAYYSIAERIPNIFDQARQTYSTVFFPEIVSLLKTDRDKAKQLLRTSMETSCVLLATAAFLFFILGERVMVLIFSEDYKTVASAVALLLFAKIFLFSGNFMGQTLVALGQNKAPFRINIGITILIIALCFFFLPRYGYVAAIYIAIFTSLIGFAANIFYLKFCEIYIELDKKILLMVVSFFLVAAAFISDQKIFIVMSSSLFLILLVLACIRVFRNISAVVKDRTLDTVHVK